MNFKRLLSVTLVISLFLTMICPVSAVTPRYNYTRSIYADIEIDTMWGVATCTGKVIADGVVPVKLLLHLQVYRNGGWETVKSWEITDTFTAYLSKPYAIYRGYEYRVYAVGFVYNNDNAVVEIVDVCDSQWYN